MPGIIDADGKRATTKPAWTYPEAHIEFLCRQMCTAVGRDAEDIVPVPELACMTPPELEERRQLNLTISRQPSPTPIWRTLRGRAWDALATNEALQALYEVSTRALGEAQAGRSSDG